jgi:hypothetical protein
MGPIMFFSLRQLVTDKVVPILNYALGLSHEDLIQADSLKCYRTVQPQILKSK